MIVVYGADLCKGDGCVAQAEGGGMSGTSARKQSRRSIRFKGYDYSLAGAYSVTICVQDSPVILSEIVDGTVALKDPGHMVQEIWESIPRKFPEIMLDAFVIMPNHVHFIIFQSNPDVGVDLRVHPGQTREEDGQTRRSAPTGDARSSIPRVVQWFKSFTTTKYRHGVRDRNWPPFPGRMWQRNYWERIIRNERELEAIRRYIWNNPANWKKDRLHSGSPRWRR